MKKKVRLRNRLIADPADLPKQAAGMKRSPSKTGTYLQALPASETRYRHLFETALDGILILDTASIEELL